MSVVHEVMVSIPTKENIHAETVGWLLNAIKNCNKLGYGLGVHIVYSPFPIECQRNNQFKDFLLKENAKYTHIFLLDSDCVPMEGTIEKLLDHDKDIVASVAPSLIKGAHCFTAAWYRPDEPAEDRFRMLEVNNEKAHGLQKVDGVGATGVLIKRHVIETMKYPWFKVEYTDDAKIVRGEDYYFCHAAQEAGFEIWADFDLRQRHYKTIAL